MKAYIVRTERGVYYVDEREPVAGSICVEVSEITYHTWRAAMAMFTATQAEMTHAVVKETAKPRLRVVK